MKNILLLLILIVLSFNFVSATTIWTTEGVKINQAKEKIEVGTDKIGGPVIFNVTDVFLITIPKELNNNTIFFSITPTLTSYDEGPNVSGISGGIGELGYCNLQSQLDDSFGVKCMGDNFKSSALINFSVNRVNIIEFNSSDLDWNKYLTFSGDKMVYVTFNYILHNVAIETEEYVTLWIGNLKCDSNHIDCFNGSKIIYVSIPTEYFVSGGDNHQIITTLDTGRRMFDSGIRMVYFSKNPSLDMVFSLQDTRKQKWGELRWFIMGILISFFLALVANSMFQERLDIGQQIFILFVGIAILLLSAILIGGILSSMIFLLIPITIFSFLYKKLENYLDSPVGKKKFKRFIKRHPKIQILFKEDMY